MEGPAVGYNDNFNEAKMLNGSKDLVRGLQGSYRLAFDRAINRTSTQMR